MKKAILILFTLGLTINVNAQQYKTSQDSITVVYDALFSKLQQSFLYKDSVDWAIVKTETKAKLSKYSDFKKSLNEIIPLFKKIGATHCAIQYEGKEYNIPAKFSPDSFSDQWKKKYATNPVFEVKMTDDKYGYILIPALNFLDSKPKNVNKMSQQLYDRINAVKVKNDVDGWIIDLRFNSGGNSLIMVLALYDFLGNNNISATLDKNKKQIKMTSLSDGNYMVDAERQYHIKPKGKLLDNAKVAIITGKVTASAGEDIAMAFKGRPNTIFIGENSAGFTSANYLEDLPFGIMINLTKEYVSDRNGNFYDKITPDILVSKEDNFDNLLLDKNIQQAVKFLAS